MISRSDDNVSEIRYAMIRAARELCRWHPNPDRGLEFLQPYLNVDAFNGIKPSLSDVLVSHVSAVVADCHRERGDYVLAAQWYDRASNFSESCFFADHYVDMVVKHRISEYYASALVCRERAEIHWKAKLLGSV